MLMRKSSINILNKEGNQYADTELQIKSLEP